jgi:hypothetical protein
MPGLPAPAVTRDSRTGITSRDLRGGFSGNAVVMRATEAQDSSPPADRDGSSRA